MFLRQWCVLVFFWKVFGYVQNAAEEQFYSLNCDVSERATDESAFHEHEGLSG